MVMITAVVSRKHLKAFAALPKSLYRGLKGFCANLDTEALKIVDPLKNPFFEHADSQLFLAWDGRRIVGRIAAIVDHSFISHTKERTGYFGFFDCVDDLAIAQSLLSTAENWLKNQQVNRIIGPLSPSTAGEVGVMTGGFEERPMIMMPFHPPYMSQLLEKAGYLPHQDLYAYNYDILAAPIIDRHQLTARFAKYGNLQLRPFNMAKLPDEIAKLIAVYNDAWAGNWGFVPFTQGEIDHLGHAMQPILDPALIWFVDLDGEPVGVILGLPNLYQIIPDLNGKLLPFGWAKLLWRLKIRRSIDSLRVALFGIRRKYQQTRLSSIIAALLLESIREGATNKGYKSAELGWILDSNGQMNQLLKNIGSVIYKTYRVYSKELIH